MSDFLPILALGVACYALRLCFVLFVPASRLPGPIQRALGHVAPAMLAALVAVSIVKGASGVTLAATAGSVVALTAVAVIAWRTHSLTLTVGIAVLAVVLLDVLPLG
jgi:branched-subunit amino acid transport protein